MAIPIAEYQQNLRRAITALDTLAQVDENETESDFNQRVKHTIEGVRRVLPQHQTIEAEAESCEVDNAWLHKSLDEIEKIDADEQAQRITQVVETLRALEARVVERENPGRLSDSKEQAKSRLESILARPEYVAGAQGPNALVRLIQDIMRWLQKFLPKPRTINPGRVDLISLIAQILVIGAAVLVLVYVVKILLARFGRSGKVKTKKKREPRIVLGERLEPEATATDLLSEAEALARQGDLRAAIRKAYIALLVELGDRKLISLAHHKTNRDYLNSVRSIPQLHSHMRRLTDSFERHWYGFAGATANDWQDFRTGYLAALQSEN
ncbi:MAG TPA: DUF4129 domain-containing protein [Pyrinomonadaceae bacterium]